MRGRRSPILRVLPLLLVLAASRAGAQIPQPDLPAAVPEDEGFDSEKLIQLAEWVRDSKLPIYSILVSHDGKLVLELYTGQLGRNEAHYVMSVTKTIHSAAIGLAVDRGLLPDPETASIATLLPPAWFQDDVDRRRFDQVTLKQILGMSALDAGTPPHDSSPAGAKRGRAFWAARNRVAFALTQPLVPRPGVTFRYNDITPLLATGALVHATRKSAFDFLQETLFRPLGFRNAEWMHTDPSGIDNGGYGLRLRPIDLHKFGVLYLRKGRWGTQQVLSSHWVERSLTPWIKSHDGPGEPNYGWYWWTSWFPSGWKARAAHGWKGQRIWIFPERDVVVTTTGYLERDEMPILDKMLKEFVIPAVEEARGKRLTPSQTRHARLATVLADLQAEPLRLPPAPQPRMVPSVKPKERRRPLLGTSPGKRTAAIRP